MIGAAESFDAVIVGGGFYGCVLAIHLRQRGLRRVLVIEREPGLLRRASYVNQARIHNGYHYPRSFVTALRSRVNFPRFIVDYRDCVKDDFEKYYAIGRIFSNVTALQFWNFCKRIEAPIERASDEARAWFDPELIEDVFRVQEWVFDAVQLADRVREDLDRNDVVLWLESEASKCRRSVGGTIEISCRRRKAEEVRVAASLVCNCTYSRANKLLADSDFPIVPLKHELTEMALVEVPAELQDVGITVMCGPFFSLMPFPPRKMHTLSHVRYTPHYEWYDEPSTDYRDPYSYFDRVPKKSNFPHMIQDAKRYLPILGSSRYVDSLWEVKTVLPKNEIDDGRPILLHPGHDMRGVTTIVGSKIDNVYDMMESIAFEETLNADR